VFLAEQAPSTQRVVVIGGGLSGLAAAHRFSERAGALRRPIELAVLEARDRVGGAVCTHRRDGFIIEHGADSFITNKPWGVDLCRTLGLTDRLVGTDPQHRRSFVVRQGRLVPVPEGFVLLAPNRLGPILTTPILSFRGKLRLLLDLLLPRRALESDESLSAFVKRRLGREVLERLVQPLVAGIYTADPNELSLKATLPQFPAMEAEYGSLIWAALRHAKATRAAERNASGARYGLFVTLAEGMDGLPCALEAALPPGTVHTSTAVRWIARQAPAGPWRIELLDGPAIEADAVILTTEAHSAARLLDGFDSELALHLRSIPYASSVVVSMAYRRDQVSHPLDGFGAVVPALEDRSILAVSFASVKFPGRAPQGTVLLRAFLGGATRPDLFEREDDDLVALARSDLADLLGARGQPILVEVSRHARAMPQYTLGHLDRVAEIRRLAMHHPGLALAGNAYDGVGIPDCIRSGQEAAELTLKALADPGATAAA
jgi:oxygen-dependent protoporphyrinogen oxidase